MAKKKVATSAATVAPAPAKKASVKKKSAKASSEYFDGFAPIMIEELETAAERYETIKEQRMSLTEREVQAKEELLAAMEDHAKRRTPGMDKTVDGHPKYHARGIHRIVELEPAGGLVVKVKKEPKPPKAEE